ncbi:MAG: hypothetical protein JWN00_5145, partial [Actinomycetia bacterium]|nr:hypothetical protein [Actinomycetes bacterium]
HDSLGLFAQRPSQGWGTPAQVTDPLYASRQFYTHLIKVTGWQALPLTQAAQAVQHSGLPGAYARWEPFSTTLVNQLGAQTSTCSSTVPTTTGLGGAIVAYAEKWLGTPYQYGGGGSTGPSVGQNSNGSGQPGFDCSGLTQYAVYQATHGRLTLPRTAAEQFHDSSHVKLIGYNQLQPGDLVFWAGADGTRTNPGHIGIYVGSQRFINAPFTGAAVRFDSMAPGTYRYQSFIAGGRVVTG